MIIYLYGKNREILLKTKNSVQSIYGNIWTEYFTEKATLKKGIAERTPDMLLGIITPGMDSEMFEELEQVRYEDEKLYIVICSYTSRNAVKAFAMHSNAFLVAPTKEDIRKEIEYYLSNKYGQKSDVYVQTFGSFDVFINGSIMNFSRSRSKEVLAYLVDKKGSEVTANQFCCMLWEDEGINRYRLKQLYVFISSLKENLNSYGVVSLLVKTKLGYAINRNMFSCDYYEALDGDKRMQNQYLGDYMSQYSWAENTNAYLTGKFLSKENIPDF